VNLRPTRWIRLMVAALAVATTGTLLAPVAGGAPVDDKRAKAQELEGELASAESESAAIGEQLNAATIELAEAQEAIEGAQTKIAAAQAEADRLKALVNDRAAAAYKHAGGGNAFADLDVNNANEFEARSKYSAAATSKDDELIDQLSRAQEELAVQRAEAERARSEAEAQRDELASARNAAEANEGRLRELESQVKGELADLVEQERDARQRVEADAAERSISADRPSQSDIPVNLPSASGGAGTAVAWALAQVGKPYCYAGTGPGCFDCSGLTMMAWAAAGVSMPHFSGAQFGAFPKVPLSQLQPGDLLFHNDPGAHVSMYIGGGQKVAATHTGDFVRVQSMSGITQAVRPG